MRLHIGGVCAEQLLDAVDRELLGNVDIFTTALIPFAGIALCVFVGQLSALRLHDCGRGIVFARDQFDMVFLSLVFVLNGRPKFRVSLRHQLRALVHVVSVRKVQGLEGDSLNGLKFLALSHKSTKPSSAGVLGVAMATLLPLAMSCNRCCSANTLPT